GPMRLASRREPFDDPDWLYEIKYDGFRALAQIESGACQLVSRKGHIYLTVLIADAQRIAVLLLPARRARSDIPERVVGKQELGIGQMGAGATSVPRRAYQVGMTGRFVNTYAPYYSP